MIKIGDYITAYHKGIHKVLKVEHKLIYYVKYFNVNMKPSSKIKNKCDVAWCTKVEVSNLKSELNEINKSYNDVITLLESK